MLKLKSISILFISLFTVSFLFTLQSCKENEVINTPDNPNIPTFCNQDLTDLYNHAMTMIDSSNRGWGIFYHRDPNFVGAEYHLFKPIVPLSSECITKQEYYDFFDTTTVDIPTEFPQLRINPSKVNRKLKVYRQLDSLFSVDNSLINNILLAYLLSDSANRRLVIHMDSIAYNGSPIGGHNNTVLKLEFEDWSNILVLNMVRTFGETYMNYKKIHMSNTPLAVNIFQLIKTDETLPQFSKTSDAIRSFAESGFTTLTGDNAGETEVNNKFHQRLVFSKMPGHSCSWDRTRKYEWIHDLINNGFYMIYDSDYADPIKVKVTLN